MTRSVVNTVANNAPAAGHRITSIRLDGTRSLELTELFESAGRLARRLRDLGIGPGDRIGILAANSLDWVLLDLAALRLKAVTAGFEPAKFKPEAGLLERYSLKVLFTDRPVDGGDPAADSIRPISDVAALLEAPDEGPALPPVVYETTDTTTIKFTSGSTGEPKGLAPTVGSMDSTLNAVQGLFEHGDEDDLFLFLPLSLLQQRYWIYSALCFGHDITISTYEAAFATIARAKPTVVMGVPGFFEAAKKHMETRAGKAVTRGADPAEALRDAALSLFGPRIRYLWTGSAPARASMLEFFTAAGMPIFEGYGLNETDIVAKNHPGAHREGSVGQVLPGKKVLFDADGVISVQSDYPVNLRYAYSAPGDSERVFGPDGVVRTGDLGHIDQDGFLFIHGRADDVIVLDNGKKVIVRPIEEFLKASPAIEECVLFCPTQTHLAVVVSAADDPADEAAIHEQVARANATFTADEQIKRVVVADERFTVENELLGSQFKPRRPQILDLYRARLS